MRLRSRRASILVKQQQKEREKGSKKPESLKYEAVENIKFKIPSAVEEASF